MDTHAFILATVVILSAAVVVIVVSHRFRIPSIVGFLITGMIIGPPGLGLITDTAEIDVFAEIGVVILLFTIGLEFSLDRLRQVQRPFFLGGALQAFGTLFVIGVIARGMGVEIPNALFFGFLAVISSTAIVLKTFAERQELESPHGKILIGISLFQDFLVVPILVLTPVLAGRAEATAGAIALRFGGGLIAIAATFAVARYLMPHVLRAIVRTRVRELFAIASLAICLGLASLTSAFHFSLALGAFLGGIIIAESEYSPQISAEVSPFRDVFNSIFFISIGMLVERTFAIGHPLQIIGIAMTVIAVKAVVVVIAVRVMAFPSRTAVMAGIGLAQIGEFSFVIARFGMANGLLASDTYQLFLASAILTMIVSPGFIALAPVIASSVGRGAAITEPASAAGTRKNLSDHVIIVGYGLNGANVSRVLKETGIPYVILELNGETVRSARDRGEPMVFGDTTRPDVLLECDIGAARVIVFAISDPLAVRRGVVLARQLNPGIHSIVRTRLVAETDGLHAAGANEVVPEEFETSIEIFTRVLSRYHVPGNVVRAQTKLLRGDAYRMLRSGTPSSGLGDSAAQWLAGGTTELYLVDASHASAGATIRSLDLRRKTGATIIAVVRGEQSITNPSADQVIEGGDVLVLVGNHADMEKAFDYLEAKTSHPGGTTQPETS